MFTFLPKPYKSEVLKEHRMRVALVFLGLLIAVMILGAVLTLPTFLATFSQRSSMTRELARVQNELSVEKGVEIGAEVKAIKARLSVLSAKASRKPVIIVLEELLAQPRPGLSITGISMRREGDKGIIAVQGTADTREHLVAFSKGLQGEPAFSKVDLPVSSLAKGKDISFTIRIESTF